MSDQDQDQKTEDPSGKRLEEAREHGQLPISREVATWISLLGVLLVISMVAPSMARELCDLLRVFIEVPDQISIDENKIQGLFFHIYTQGVLIAGIAFVILMAGLIGGYMLQTGFFFSLELMAPDLEKLSPMRGLSRLFSISSIVELVKSLLKLVFLGGIAYVILKPIAVESPGFTGFPLEAFLAFMHKKLVYLIEMLLVSFLVIAAADFFYTRFQYIRGLRMSKAEVKEEYKQQEGDPMIKARLRQLRVEKTRKRMMARVPKADVIITNPTHYAVALEYKPEKMAAPVVVAKGINLIAQRIRELGEENRVPVVSNPPLARALYSAVELDQPIPTQHYRAVAEVISYVYKLRKKRF